MINYIYDYHDQIQRGEVTVGKWIRLLYEYIIKGLTERRFFFDIKKANKAIKFIENFCRHHEGPLAPGLIKLELWQKAAVSIIFGAVDDNGMRQFREVFIVIARKNGKTLFAAAIAAYCLYLDGEYGAREYFAAPKLEQSAICYDALYQMVLNEPELLEISKKRRSDIYIAESNSTAKPIAFSAKKSDGFNPHLAVCDEIASWQGDPGLKFYEVLKSAFGARKQPIILGISTAGYINDGIYDELMKRSTAVLMGNSNETRLLAILYIIDDPNKWNEKEELKKSNPNLDISVPWDFYKEEIAVAEKSLSKKAEFLTKYCNIKQNSSVAWLPYEVIDAVTELSYTLEDFRNSYCVGGFDLSQTTDLTAASVIIERKGRLYTFCQFFMPQNKIQYLTEREGFPYEIYVKRGIITPAGENFVDYKYVFDWYRRLVEEYEIYPLMVGYDRYSSQYLVQDMTNYGFHMDFVTQGLNLTPVVQECEGLIRDKTLELGANDLLKAHFLNTALKVDSEQRKCMPVKIEAKAHIDGAMSVIDALTVRQKYHDTLGEQLKNE